MLTLLFIFRQEIHTPLLTRVVRSVRTFVPAERKSEQIKPGLAKKISDLFSELASSTYMQGPSCYPANPFTILVPHDQEIGEFYGVQERRATDFEASKL